MSPTATRLIALAAAAAFLVLPACQNVPKYKHSGGKYDGWKSFEAKNFSPSTGTVTAIDATAGTITITQHNGAATVYAVTAETRIMHEGDDIPLAKLPLNQVIKFTLTDDHKHLLTVWYGTHLNAAARPGGSKKK